MQKNKKLHNRFIVLENDDNLRIDLYLTKKLNISRSQIDKLINKKSVTINNKVINKNGYKVFNNDIVEIINLMIDENTSVITNLNDEVNFDLEIIYEDDYCWIFNKPNDILVYPTQFNESNTISNYLKKTFPNLNFVDQQRYGIIHRLDKKTTGLILVAKNQLAYEKLSQLLTNQLITRKYTCIVHNCFDQSLFKFKIANKIGRSYQNMYKMQVNTNKDSKDAITIVNVIKNIANTHALVECDLITGRTHQVRVHMKYINHCILNDELYGCEKHPTNYGQYLYCSQITFLHPFLNKEVNIKLPLPIEFISKIDELEND